METMTWCLHHWWQIALTWAAFDAAFLLFVWVGSAPSRDDRY